MKKNNVIDESKKELLREVLNYSDEYLFEELTPRTLKKMHNFLVEHKCAETFKEIKSKGQILDFFRMIEKNVIPLTSIQTAYVVGQTAGCELGNINAHYYIEYTIESLDVERLEQMINLVISKNDALRLIVTHEGKASFLDNVPYYSVPVYSLYDGNDREQKRLERSHHRYNYYKWPMFHFCVGKTSGKTSVLHVDFDCIILDAWSAKLLLNEIFSLYYGKDVKFPRISFMNYMRLKTDKGDLEAEEYWKEKVKNMPSFPKLNYQKKFAEVQNVRFDRIECDFSFIETQRLYQKIKNYHFTPAAVISTIFMKTLAQYSETPGLSINVTLFNRQLLHEDVNGILGEFTNNAVISYQEKTDSLLDAIRATQEQMWRLVQYRKFEGSNILKMLSSGRAGKAIMPVVFSEMASLCITKASELLGENIIINRIFLINPSKAKESDLYLGDISIIDGNSVAIKSWEKAVLGNVREFESNSNDIFDIIMRELENDK